MLLPRFTIRTLFVAMAGGALFSVAVGAAVRGQHWAWGVAAGVLSLAVAALVHAACFGIVWLFVQWFGQSTSVAGATTLPTADHDQTAAQSEESA